MYNIPKLIQKKQKLSPFDQSQPTTVNIEKGSAMAIKKIQVGGRFLKTTLVRDKAVRDTAVKYNIINFNENVWQGTNFSNMSVTVKFTSEQYTSRVCMYLKTDKSY